MAIRQTKLIIKNSDIVNRPLPNNLLKGEGIVNTAEGILYFSGVTTSTSEWTPAGTGTTANFFEVGSNLYDLNLRNKITKYQGASGAGLVGKFLSGTTSGFVLADISQITGADTYVTGFTYNNSNTLTIAQNLGQSNLSITINQMSGLTVNGTLNATTILSGGTDLNTIFSNNDSYATGYTYNSTNNTFTLTGKNNFTPLNASFNTVSGLSVTDLTTNKLVYTTTGGKLITGNANFDGTNMSLPTAGSLSVGTGGLVVGSGGSSGVAGTGDLTVHGNLVLFGSAVSAFTSQLYVEDSNIILNYNPVGNTTVTSVGAGLTIQDGNGIASGDVKFEIRPMDSFTGLTGTEIPSVTEYSSSTGYLNRAFITQLNDIVVRSNNVNTPNGVRLLAEFDTLDGGFY